MRDSTVVYQGATNSRVTAAASEDTGTYTCSVTINGVESDPSNIQNITVAGKFKTEQ